MKKPDYLTEHEWAEMQRNALNDLNHEIYYAPMWVKKVSRVLAILIVTAIVVTIVLAVLAAGIEIIRGE